MTSAQIIGWRNYGVATLCLLIGLWAFSRGNVDGGLKALLAGLAIISLRNVLGKLLAAVDENRQSLEGLRAAIETELSTRKVGQ